MRLESESDTTFSITFVNTGDRFVIDHTGEITGGTRRNFNK